MSVVKEMIRQIETDHRGKLEQLTAVQQEHRWVELTSHLCKTSFTSKMGWMVMIYLNPILNVCSNMDVTEFTHYTVLSF